MVNAALDGIGLGYVPDHLTKPHMDSGRLIEVLADWCPLFKGCHLHYPNRRQPSPAFSAFVELKAYPTQVRQPRIVKSGPIVVY